MRGPPSKSAGQAHGQLDQGNAPGRGPEQSAKYHVRKHLVDHDIHEAAHEAVRSYEDIGGLLDRRGADIAPVGAKFGQQEIVVTQIPHPNERRTDRVDHDDTGHCDKRKAPDTHVVEKEQRDDREKQRDDPDAKAGLAGGHLGLEGDTRDDTFCAGGRIFDKSRTPHL